MLKNKSITTINNKKGKKKSSSSHIKLLVSCSESFNVFQACMTLYVNLEIASISTTRISTSTPPRTQIFYHSSQLLSWRRRIWVEKRQRQRQSIERESRRHSIEGDAKGWGQTRWDEKEDTRDFSLRE